MFSKVVLPNGVRLITVPKKSAESVTMLVLVRAGSKYETKETNGISHFLEHLLFRGTKKRGAREIAILMDRMGGASNAFTSQEYTGYWAKADRVHFPVVADLLADIFLNARLAPQEIEKERGTVLEEIKLYNDTPSDKIGDIFNDLLYGDQPAGWEIVGRPEVIKRLKQRDFRIYIQRHYVAAGTVVVVAGDVDSKSLKKSIERLFTHTPKTRPPALLRTKESQARPQVKILRKETDQTQLALGVRTFSFFDERRFTLEVLRTILGAGFSSRLFQEIREKRGAAYSVYTDTHLTSDAGFLVTSAGVAHERIQEVVQAVVREYQRIASMPAGLGELKKAKERIAGSLALRLETTDALGAYFGTQEITLGKALTPHEYLKHIQRVSARDVLGVARDIMKARSLNLAIIGPHEAKLAAGLENLLAKGLR